MKISFALLAFSLAQEDAVANEENVAVEERKPVRDHVIPFYRGRTKMIMNDQEILKFISEIQS